MVGNERLYLLDLGMVGEVGPEMREQLILLLMAFWQQDVPVPDRRHADARGGEDRNDLDIDAFGAELGAMIAKYRTASLRDIQLGPILQEVTEISLRHEVPLPAPLALTGKALAQMQLATAELDPDLDPFDVAGSFLMRALVRDMTSKADPKALFYQAQRFKVRFHRVVEAVERLAGARPGQKLEVNFRATRWRPRSAGRGAAWRWPSPRAPRSWARPHGGQRASAHMAARDVRHRRGAVDAGLGDRPRAAPSLVWLRPGDRRRPRRPWRSWS